MKVAGVAPIANQGKYPMYLTYPYLTEFIARIAGPSKLEACFNLEPNSWTDPKVVQAFTFLKNLIDNYFEKGHLGMNHLESQAEVMVGHAGLIACGSWFPKLETTLENNLSLMEEGKATPEEVCTAIQAMADKLRNDPAVVKHQFSLGYSSK